VILFQTYNKKFMKFPTQIVQKNIVLCLKQGFPTWGTCTPRAVVDLVS